MTIWPAAKNPQMAQGDDHIASAWSIVSPYFLRTWLALWHVRQILLIPSGERLWIENRESGR
jgi:hypothetical protein